MSPGAFFSISKGRCSGSRTTVSISAASPTSWSRLTRSRHAVVEMRPHQQGPAGRSHGWTRRRRRVERDADRALWQGARTRNLAIPYQLNQAVRFHPMARYDVLPTRPGRFHGKGQCPVGGRRRGVTPAPSLPRRSRGRPIRSAGADPNPAGPRYRTGLCRNRWSRSAGCGGSAPAPTRVRCAPMGR